MDGVIVDSGPYHMQAWQKTFRGRGVDFTEADFRRHFGQRNDEIIRANLGRGASQSEIDTIAGEKETVYRSLIAEHITAFPGAVALMKALVAKGIRMAIASSAPPENIELIVSKLDIKDCFGAIVWGRQVTEGKPSPQLFLLAADKLGVSPQNSVVIEDAIAGVLAARRAGMKCVAVTNTNAAPALAEAELVVDSLEKVTTDVLEGLFQSLHKEEAERN